MQGREGKGEGARGALILGPQTKAKCSRSLFIPSLRKFRQHIHAVPHLPCSRPASYCQASPSPTCSSSCSKGSPCGPRRTNRPEGGCAAPPGCGKCESVKYERLEKCAFPPPVCLFCESYPIPSPHHLNQLIVTGRMQGSKIQHCGPPDKLGQAVEVRLDRADHAPPQQLQQAAAPLGTAGLKREPDLRAPQKEGGLCVEISHWDGWLGH